MKGLRYLGTAFLIALAASTSGCKPKEGAVVKSPTPPNGFKNEKKWDRHDEDGGTIDVWVALGDDAIIVNSSTASTTDIALGWISNEGKKKEKVYGFRPSDKATYKLYARSAANGGGWRLEEDPTGGGPTTPDWKVGQFMVCDTHKVDAPDIGFKLCSGTASSTPMASHASMTGGPFRALYARFLALFLAPAADVLDAPGWTACTDGCCTW